MWSDSSGEISSAGSAAHNRWSLTMAHSSLASRSPPSLRNTRSSNTCPLQDCLKKRLEGAEGKWVDELPGVLWAYRTTKRRSTGETPFSLAYGTEAIIPPHVNVPSIGIEVGSIEQNSEQMRLNLDLLEGEREKAIVRVASYQQRLKSYYDKRAKIRQFEPGDLVLRKAFITAQRQGSKRIKPNWEGPYVISQSGGRGSYTLDTMDGKEIPLQCNAYHLRNVLRETQGNDQKRPSGDAAHKKRPKEDVGCARNFLREVSSPLKRRPKGDTGCARNFLKGGLHASCGMYPGSYPFSKGGRIVIQLPISSVLRETQGNDQKRPSGDAAHKKRPKGDVGCARNFLREDSNTVAHKQRPKGGAGRRLKASVWRRSPLKKRPKGDVGCARNFLKGGLHASCGKYPGSYPFPKGDRIVTQLPISSVLRETQGDDQAILRGTLALMNLQREICNQDTSWLLKQFTRQYAN
ncbi:unnamed protein product [Prunus armeniaca]